MLDSATTKYAFLSRCKNFSADATIPNKKEVRMDEEAEFYNFIYIIVILMTLEVEWIVLLVR